MRLTGQSENLSIAINEVEDVNINTNTNEANNTLTKSEIQKVKSIITEEYNVSENNIGIN